MFGIRLMTRAFILLSTVAALAWQADNGHAQSIDLSLNVFYNTPTDVNSGGVWELVAKASNFGLAGLEAKLVNINTANNVAPNGKVNSSDPAGFGFFADVPYTTYRALILGQVPLTLSNGEEQGAFYGVGQLANGSPDYAGKPMGANSEGPTLGSLTMPQGIPWGTVDAFGDGVWASAARLAIGTFAADTSPAFAPGSSGNVFSTLGSSASFGTRVSASVLTIIRTNAATSPDYNDNGVVDAADYVLWRHTLGQAVTPGSGADGNNSGFVDQPDFDLWRANFGVGSGSGASLHLNAIPEPTTSLLLALVMLLSSAGSRVRCRS